MEKLIRALKSVEKPALNADKKKALKLSLMENVVRSPQQQAYLAYGDIISAIRKLVSEIKIEKDRSADLKVRVMEMVENHSQKRFFWSNFFSLHKTFAGAMLTVLMFFGVFNFMSFQPKIVSASGLTILADVSGGVLVERDGEFIDIEEGMRLFEGDVITTAQDGVAVIQYFDDSVTRLAVDTQVVINELDKPNNWSVSSYVEIGLVNGAVWSKVFNVVEEQSAFVVEASDVYASAKKAAFNVKNDGIDVEVGVFNHAVEVKKDREVNKVATGEKVKVNSASKLVQKSKIDKREKEDEWVKDNLAEDKQYLGEVEERVLAKNLEKLGVDSKEQIKLNQSDLRDNTAIFLTFDDVKKAKMRLDLAEKNFVAAQVKLTDGSISDEDREEAEAVISNFVKEIESYGEFVDTVVDRDAKYAADLEVYLEDKLLSQKKDLSSLKPDNPAFVAKKALDEIEILTAQDEKELLAIKKDQANEKLYVLEDAINSNNLDLAEQAVVDYKKHISDSAEIVERISEESEEGEEIAKEFVAKVTDDLAVINSLDEGSEIGLVSKEATSEVLKLTEKAIQKNVSLPVQPVDVVKSPVLDVDKEGVETELADTDVVESGRTEAEKKEDKIDERLIEREEVKDGPFGSSIEGDKPLDPLLR